MTMTDYEKNTTVVMWCAVDDQRSPQKSRTSDGHVLWKRVRSSGGKVTIAALQQSSCSRPHGCYWPRSSARLWPASTRNASAAIPSIRRRRPCPRRQTTRRPPAPRPHRPPPQPSTDTEVPKSFYLLLFFFFAFWNLIFLSSRNCRHQWYHMGISLRKSGIRTYPKLNLSSTMAYYFCE